MLTLTVRAPTRTLLAVTTAGLVACGAPSRPERGAQSTVTLATSTAAAGVAAPAASAPGVTASLPAEPLRLASYSGGVCDLRVVDDRVYWLEIRSGSASQQAPGGKGSWGAVLTCAEAAGALVRASRTSPREDVVTFRYRPFDLAARGSLLSWTGAPCSSHARSGRDPDWLWLLDTRADDAPAVLGDLDRHYLGAVTTADSLLISDRFGRGGAYRFRGDDTRGAEVLPESESPWLVAADAHALYWTDRSWVLFRTTLGAHDKTTLGSLGAMPTEGHLVGDRVLVRTTEALVLIPAVGGEPRRVAALPSYGDRGSGAYDGRRFYYWADGTTALRRLDVTTGESRSLEVPGASQVCGLALDGDALYLADRGARSVSLWRASAFEATRPSR